MRLIDADAIQIPNTSVDMFENCRNCNLLDADQVREIIDSALTIETKHIKYFDEDEKVWKIGNVIVEQKNDPQTEMPEYAEWKEPFEKMTDCLWK